MKAKTVILALKQIIHLSRLLRTNTASTISLKEAHPSFQIDTLSKRGL